MDNMQTIDVAAGIIWRGGHFLASQRPTNKVMEGYWEFPGGKLEQGETPEEALIREIKEEFDSEIEIVSFINEASHEYDFGIVTMKTYRSKLHTGNLTLLEHQDSKWLPIEELDTLEWAPVDLPAVKCLQQK